MNYIETLIRSSVVFVKKRVTGYEMLKCPVCNDYKVRAGFKFENYEIDYHCFNCSYHARYIEGEQHVSHKFRKALTTCGITDEQIDNELSKYFFNPQAIKKSESEQKFKNLLSDSAFKPVKFPEDTHPLFDWPVTNIWRQVAEEYVKSRNLSLDACNWHISSDEKFSNRLIIPYFRKDTLIYWEARTYIDMPNTQRYLSASESDKSIVLFNFDEALRYTDDPLYVCEGAFNALSIRGGISLAGSKISPDMINFLKTIQKRREIVFVLDKHDRQGNGYKLGKTAVSNGFSISYISGSIKDPNDAIGEMGRIWTIQDIANNTVSGFSAEVVLEQIIR